MQQTWVNVIKRTFFKVVDARVCSRHFDESSFTILETTKGSKKSLKKSAIPGINLPKVMHETRQSFTSPPKLPNKISWPMGKFKVLNIYCFSKFLKTFSVICKLAKFR